MTHILLLRTISSESEMSEDLALTPTPRPEIQWGLLPNDIIMKIIRTSTDNGRLTTLKYWEDQLSRRMKPSIVLSEWKREPTKKNVAMTEFHMNKVRTIRVLRDFQYDQQEEEGGYKFTYPVERYEFLLEGMNGATKSGLKRLLQGLDAFKAKEKVKGL